jgi:hypothetical protein
MLACVDDGQIPEGFRKRQLKDAASKIRQYLLRHDSKQGARRADSNKGKATARRKKTRNTQSD